MREILPGQNCPLDTYQLVLRVSGEPAEEFTAQTLLGAFLLAADGRVGTETDFIAPTRLTSADNAVVLDSAGRALRLDLNRVAERISKIAVVLSMRGGLGRGATFGTFAAIQTRVADAADVPLVAFSLPLVSRGEKALILVEFYRHAGRWKLRAVGQGFDTGLPALAAHFGLTIEEPAPPPRGANAPPMEGARFTGTGFCISPEGYFLTNYHVIEGARDIQAGSPRNRYRMQAVFADPTNDLALLKADTATPRVAIFRDGAPARLGETVLVIGYPLSGLLGSSPQVTTGNVSSLIGPGDDTRSLQFTAPVQSGNSGGPLLDADGAVIGMVRAKLNVARVHEMTGDIPQNVNFAIKGALVRSFLEAVGIDYQTRPMGASRAPTAVAAEAQGFVVRIECEG